MKLPKKEIKSKKKRTYPSRSKNSLRVQRKMRMTKRRLLQRKSRNLLQLHLYILNSQFLIFNRNLKIVIQMMTKTKRMLLRLKLVKREEELLQTLALLNRPLTNNPRRVIIKRLLLTKRKRYQAVTLRMIVAKKKQRNHQRLPLTKKQLLPRKMPRLLVVAKMMTMMKAAMKTFQSSLKVRLMVQKLTLKPLRKLQAHLKMRMMMIATQVKITRNLLPESNLMFLTRATLRRQPLKSKNQVKKKMMT